MRIGVVGGTSLTRLGGVTEVVDVETPYGDVRLRYARADGAEWFFLSRHAGPGTSAGPASEGGASTGVADGHVLPPHRVRYRTNAWAMRAARVDRVLAVASVGALRREIAPGTFLVPDDYLDLSDRTERTFFDEDVVHVDVTEAYCPETRAALVDGSREAGATVHDGGVYASTPGPRFETRAEVRFLAREAHVVGMTGCPEAALMRELGLCYANLSVVANHAAGVGDRAYLASDVAATARATEDEVRTALAAAARRLPRVKGCGCSRALEGAHLRHPSAISEG